MPLFFSICDYLRRHLTQADQLQSADLVFVLAGHRSRKTYAARLFRDGWAPRVLFSTSNPPFIPRVLLEESPSRIESTSKLWRAVRATAILDFWPRGQFLGAVNGESWSISTIPMGPFGTLSEIRALARWLENCPAVRSILIVSVGTHLRRLRMCCERLIPSGHQLRFIEVPQELQIPAVPGTLEQRTFASVLQECAKVVLYRIVLIFEKSRQ